MILGAVTDDGTPQITLRIGRRDWIAVIDTGFNGNLELPDALRADLSPTFLGRSISTLAADQTVVEDLHSVRIEFDGRSVECEVTFTACREILVGTGILMQHRLFVDFPRRSLRIERAPS